ncbi:MAG TPA: hypothetical protein VKJ00_01525 [Thermoanaerobaculia bacterium]|nr:hypothetical protein [Thermoanaerobaculia bacterium]
MSPCPHPIDPIDAQALAGGAEPVVDARASEHVQTCASCREQVAMAVQLDQSLDEVAPDLAAHDLSNRVIRLRPFSRRELRDLSLWRAPVGLCVGVFLAGLVALTLPALTLSEQAGLGGMAVIGPLWMLVRTLPRLLAEVLAVGPAGLAALSETLRRQEGLGLAALALLAPTAFGLSRALARARR